MLHALDHRKYDAATSQFLSVDPLLPMYLESRSDVYRTDHDEPVRDWEGTYRVAYRHWSMRGRWGESLLQGAGLSTIAWAVRGNGPVGG